MLKRVHVFFYQAPESVQVEVEENDEEVEYVVERLETDDELDESQIKDPNDDGDEVEEEEEEEDEDINLQMPMDDEDVKSSIKKIKIERAVSFSNYSNCLILFLILFKNL